MLKELILEKVSGRLQSLAVNVVKNPTTELFWGFIYENFMSVHFAIGTRNISIFVYRV